MKRILVPCDFSAPSVEAIRFANQIALKNYGHITLFHAFELPTIGGAASNFRKNFMQDLKKESHAQLEKLAAKHIGEGVKTELRIEFGKFISSITDATRELKADVIVMGTNGASGLKELTVGSNAEKVVRASSVPVIVLRKQPKAIKSIVFPTMPGQNDDKVISEVKQLQNFFGATLHVLYINTPTNFRKDIETKAALEKLAKRFMLKDYTLNVFNDTNEGDGIVNFASSTGADMVAMRTHGRRGFAHFASPSIAQEVVNQIECPIWTFKSE